MHDPIVKVAAVQAAPGLLDIEKSVEKTIAFMDEAGEQGVQLIVFPECWIGGYPWWIWLGTPEYAMHFAADYAANSIIVGDEYDVRLREAAKRNKLHAIVGVSEKSGSSLYMGQFHYGPDGEVVARRRKLKPTMSERTVFGEGDGSDMFVSDTNIGKIGSLCCWEHMQPLIKYAMMDGGEQIHAASWPAFSVYNDVSHALSPQMSLAINQVYAGELGCFVVVSCAVISDEIHTRLCDTDDRKRLMKKGGGYSCIFGPDGSKHGNLLKPDEEGLVIADIPLGKIAFAKNAADPVGHYSRPDVFQLLIDRTPRQRVRETKLSGTGGDQKVVSDVELSKDVVGYTGE